jgi:hypothetical protein
MPVHDAAVARMDQPVDAVLDLRLRWRRRPPRDPRPTAFDCTAFFVVVPLCVALWATAVGIGPARVLGFQYAFAYIGIQMLAAWGVNGVTALFATRLLRLVRLPVWACLLVGYALSWPPLYLFYLYEFELFGRLFPEIVSYHARPPVALNSEYLLHAVRYSFPFLPMWFGAIYGYRYLTGVEFFTSSRVSRVAPDDSPVSDRIEVAVAAAPDPAPQPEAPPTAIAPAAPPPFMSASRLPTADTILALKAEEHYIRIWSATGTDMIRYRFGDALQELAGRDGAQVHRSWWINWAAVRGWRQRGRSLELQLVNDQRVPVSLAYKAEVHRRLPSA